MRIEPEISGVGVVLLGDFNPAIFAPAWFAMHRLLPRATADSANLEVAHRQLTAFSADWLHLQVTTDRFTTDTAQAPHVRVRDLVVRVFREHLHHTPVRAMGINRRVHFRVGSLAERDRIGGALAPAEPWGRWRQELALDGKHGGMTSLRMSQLRPEDRSPGGSVNITVEPSKRIADASGVFVEVNDHYAAAETASVGAAELMRVLDESFEQSIRRSDGIIDHVMSLATESEES
ncbi:MAG: hypothetical protein OXH69_05295 [Acidobacteria bacterium]|nr:hypothetical protein [Acidobacteriota bacterium]